MMTYRHNPYNPCVLADCDRLYTTAADVYMSGSSLASSSCGGGDNASLLTTLSDCGATNLACTTPTTATPAQTPKNDAKAAPASAPTPNTDAVANHYKTRMCKTFASKGCCSYESYCRFAHGQSDLRTYALNVREGITTEEAVRAHQDKLAGAAGKFARKQTKKVYRKY